jgi:hypothetical protein
MTTPHDSIPLCRVVSLMASAAAPSAPLSGGLPPAAAVDKSPAALAAAASHLSLSAGEGREWYAPYRGSDLTDPIRIRKAKWDERAVLLGLDSDDPLVRGPHSHPHRAGRCR